MKKIIAIIFIFNCLFCFSQTKTIHVAKENESEVYTVVEEPAEFPGGTQEMYKYIANNIVFPNSARQDTTFSGCKTYVKFIVGQEGSVYNVELIKGCKGCSDCDKEAIRVVKAMPKWKPAKLKGEQVQVYYNLPINFKMK
ncbi:MAG: energy transducer TonB [Bacteroidia bacterium]|nr:energy transducer TonB [Bacteroidia bacterium]